jgi:glycerol-3-phosphate dehydrogenase
MASRWTSAVRVKRARHDGRASASSPDVDGCGAQPRQKFDRTASLARLAAERFDLLVVGGGVTGTGVALDAASRGLRTALVEKDDFASGTSSRSSKLVHGGLRYLQSGEVRLVYQALAERTRLQRNAPHLVSPLPFLIPLFTSDGILNRKMARGLGSALWMYDATGGVRIGKVHQRVSTEEALGYMPALRADRVAGAYLYYDAQADDARLTLALARTAAIDFGAVLANRVRVIALARDAGDRVAGCRAVDTTTGAEVDIEASVVVNATGVWSDELLALEARQPGAARCRPAKGIHVAVPWDKLRNTIAAVVPVPGDRRSIFAIPWGPVTYLGTTDTDYDGPLDEPVCTAGDVAYLLGALNRCISGEIGEADVLGSWAGLRPLVRDASSARTADLSRRHRVERGAGGMITVTGGKLTTYRQMAEDTVDEAARLLEDRGALSRVAETHRRCRTRRLSLRGADGWAELVAEAADRVGDRAELLGHLAGRYGGEAGTLLAMIDHDADLGRPLVAGLPYRRAEAVYAARYEMATTLDDVLSRRTRARLMARDASAAAAEDVADLIGPVLGWDAAEHARQVADYRASVGRELAVLG